MTDLDKRIDDAIKELEGAASANGYWQQEKLKDYVPEMYAIIKQLQAELAARERVIESLKEVGMFYLSEMKRQLTETLLEDASDAIAFKRSNLESRIRLTETKLGIAL